MLKVLAYTGGRNAPSHVFRVRQYVQPLKDAGIDLCECPSSAGAIPPARKWVRPLWGLWNVGERAPHAARSFAYDVVFFQRELLSTFVTWEPLTKRPRVFDVDDAIWVHRGGGFARRLAGLSDHVICGNHFLAEEYIQIFVQARGAAPAFDNGSGGTDNMFWNRGIWSTSVNMENDSQVQVQD